MGVHALPGARRRNNPLYSLDSGSSIEFATAIVTAMQNRKWGDACTIKFARFGEGSVTSESLPFNF